MTLTFARTKTYSVTIYRALKREHKDSKLSASNVTLPPVAGALWALEMSRQRKPCPSRTTTVCFLTRFGWNAIRSPRPTVPGTGRIIGDSGLANPLCSLSFHICPTDGCLRFGTYEVKYTCLLTLSSLVLPRDYLMMNVCLRKPSESLRFAVTSDSSHFNQVRS